MFMSPAHVQKTIIQLLNIACCNECDMIREIFFTGNIETKRKSRDDFGKKHECKLKKCIGLVNSEFLRDNECEVIGKRHSARVAQQRLKDDSKFIPHVHVVEKRQSRKNRCNRTLAMCKPIEKLRDYSNSRKDNADDAFEIEKKVANDIMDMKLEESIIDISKEIEMCFQRE